jgi:isopentenyl phosphate kinase
LNSLLFLKLGGSAITDKTREATACEDVICRIAREIKRACDASPALDLLIGHGSGSFGHFAAKKYGFGERGNWRAYAETGAAAARLNRIVADAFLTEGVPVVAMQSSASARCRDGELVNLAVEPIRTALAHNLVPLVYGDVAFDETRGMAIASTEMIFAYLAPVLKPSRIILAGIVDGVFTADPLRDPKGSARLIREITPVNFLQIESQLRGSHGVDVTGGMVAKVKVMLALVRREPSIRVQIVSAMREGVIERVLTREDVAEGTVIHAG